MGVQKIQRTASRKHHRPEIPYLNRKLTADRKRKWPRWVEPHIDQIFATFMLLEFPPPQSQNEWIALELLRRTGLRRTARQVSSHLQQRRKWFQKLYGEGASWDDYVISRGILDDGHLDISCEDASANSDDESPATPSSVDTVTLVDSEPASAVIAGSHSAVECPMVASNDFDSTSTVFNEQAFSSEPQYAAFEPPAVSFDAPALVPAPTYYLASPTPGIGTFHVSSPTQHCFEPVGPASAQIVSDPSPYPPDMTPTLAPLPVDYSCIAQPTYTACFPDSGLDVVPSALGYDVLPTVGCDSLPPFAWDIADCHFPSHQFDPAFLLEVASAYIAPVPVPAPINVFDPSAHYHVQTEAAHSHWQPSYRGVESPENGTDWYSPSPTMF